jgi:O-antigen ligase
MPLRTVLFLGLFVVCTAGALYAPILGVLGYVAHYCIGPERQWWEAPIQYWGLRYSFTLGAATAIGLALHIRRLRWGDRFFVRHEWLILAFLAVVWLSTVTSGPTTARYTTVDHPSIKLTKVIIFALMMSHIVTTPKRLDALLWTLVAGSLVLGLQAYTTPYRQFAAGRLEQVGGPDFAEANFFAAFCIAMLPIIGMQFFRSGWIGKGVALIAGAFTANAIVLTRSRGAVVGFAVGIFAATFAAPKRYRWPILAGLVVAALGFLHLSDPQFLNRASTILADEGERDPSAQNRIEILQAGWEMFKDHPLGVGAGNWYQTIGRYNEKFTRRDAHNTFLKTACELGIHGFAIFAAIIANAIIVLRRIRRRAEALPSQQRRDTLMLSFGLTTSLVAYLACCMTVTLIYIEILWWLLVLPVVFERTVANLEADVREEAPAAVTDEGLLKETVAAHA